MEHKDFLSNYGAMLVNGAEVYELPAFSSENPPLWQSVVEVTRRLRSLTQVGAERYSLIPIAYDGMDTYFFIDTSASPETRILALGPNVEKLVSSDLYGFIADFAAGNLSR